MKTYLPTGQVTGDTYNILNDFTLGGEDYLAGTNVAWNGSGWDALGSHIPNGDEVQYSLGVSVNEKIDELLANKAIDFSVVNDTKYPTTKAVRNYVRDIGLDTPIDELKVIH